MLQTKHKYVIGIDAGVKTGYAIYSRETRKIENFATGNFWDVYDHVQGFVPSENLIVIERPKKRLVYSKHSGRGAKIDVAVAFNSGENNRESSLLVEGFERLGFTVEQVQPMKRKWTAEQLARYTGITARTNEHVRDAISLCWQR